MNTQRRYHKTDPAWFGQCADWKPAGDDRAKAFRITGMLQQVKQFGITSWVRMDKPNEDCLLYQWVKYPCDEFGTPLKDFTDRWEAPDQLAWLKDNPPRYYVVHRQSTMDERIVPDDAPLAYDRAAIAAGETTQVVIPSTDGESHLSEVHQRGLDAFLLSPEALQLCTRLGKRVFTPKEWVEIARVPDVEEGDTLLKEIQSWASTQRAQQPTTLGEGAGQQYRDMLTLVDEL